jgi:hypothetical protein
MAMELFGYRCSVEWFALRRGEDKSAFHPPIARQSPFCLLAILVLSQTYNDRPWHGQGTSASRGLRLDEL